RNPKAVYADAAAAAEKAGHKIYPIMWGRAQTLMGRVKSKPRGSGKAAGAAAAKKTAKRAGRKKAASADPRAAKRPVGRPPFVVRLRDYFEEAGQVLRGKSRAAAVFANAADIGSSREEAYAHFLRQHLPAGCEVLLGGFVFNTRGEESGQIDIIVVSDSCPRFAPLGKGGKSFSFIDGTIGVLSIKSKLTRPDLRNALDNIASLPEPDPIERRLSPLLSITNAKDMPYKAIYASDCSSLNGILDTIRNYYA